MINWVKWRREDSLNGKERCHTKCGFYQEVSGLIFESCAYSCFAYSTAELMWGAVFYVHLVLLMDEITHKQTRMLKLLPNMSVTLEQIHIFKNKYNRTDCTSLCLLMQFYSKINFISPLYYIWRIKHWCLEITCIDSLCYLWPSFHHNECEITKYFI